MDPLQGAGDSKASKQLLQTDLPSQTAPYRLTGGGTLGQLQESQQDQHDDGPLTAEQKPSKPSANANGGLTLDVTPSMLLPAPDAPLLSHPSAERSQKGIGQPQSSNGHAPAAGSPTTSPLNGSNDHSRPVTADSAAEKAQLAAEGVSACRLFVRAARK